MNNLNHALFPFPLSTYWFEMSIFLAHDLLHVGTRVVGRNAIFSYYSCKLLQASSLVGGCRGTICKTGQQKFADAKTKAKLRGENVTFSYKTCYMFISLIDVIVARGLFDRFCIYPGDKRDLNV